MSQHCCHAVACVALKIVVANNDSDFARASRIFVHLFVIRELKQQRRRRQRERQQSKRLRLTKQQLCTFITLFSTFFSRHCTTITWKRLISRFVEDGNSRLQLSFSFPQFWYSPSQFNSKQFGNIWRIKRDGLSTTKFEAARIHFLSDVFRRNRRRHCCLSSLFSRHRCCACLSSLLHLGTVLRDEFWPGFLRNLVTANQRSDSLPKTFP